MIPGFVSVYKDESNLIHIYFYPGYDDYDRNIYRIDLTTKQFLDYKYVKNTDRSIEYTIVNNIQDSIEFQTIENQTKKLKNYKFKVSEILNI